MLKVTISATAAVGIINRLDAMKKILFVLLALAAAAACQREELAEQVYNPAPVGDEVQFAAVHGIFTSNGPETKTIYGDRDGNSYPIYWINGDQIGIYCPESSYPDIKQYNYKIVVDNETSSTGALAKINPDENGLQWGEGDEHNFYAIYPASAARGGVSATEVKASIPLRQDPERIEFDESTGTYTAYPNMDYAYMYAHTTAKRSEQGDKPISLNFEPLVTVLEITVNGPETDPATGPYQVSQIAVRSTENITGEFILTVSTDPETDGACTPVNDGTVSNLLTIPTYYNGAPVELKSGQKLVVKAFMLPYAHPAQATTTVTVNMVGQGSNTKILNTADIQSRKINITSLPSIVGTNFYYWLTSMDKKTYFSQLSIPGTHNSYSIGQNVVGENEVMDVYQNKSIAEQFSAGARAFSLMVGFNRDEAADAVDSRNGERGVESFTNWNNDYDLAVYDGESSTGSTLEDALDEYVNLLSNVLNNYKGPEGRACQEFIVLHIDYKQITGSGFNNADKYKEVKRWIREVDRILNNYTPAGNVSFATGINAQSTIEDLMGKILVFVNYQCPNLPSAEGAVEHGKHLEWFQWVENTDDEEYAGFTYDPNDGVTRNYIFMRNVYDASGASISSSIWAKNDRDLVDTYYMVPEGSGSDVRIWKQTLQRLDNPTLSSNNNISPYDGRIAVKIEMATSFIDQAVQNNIQTGTAGLNNWYINNLGGFCVVNESASYDSARGESGNTVLAANAINEEIYHYLIDPSKNSGPLGIMLMNFFGNKTLYDNPSGGNIDIYGELLPQIIIENNFRFNLKRKGDSADMTGYDYASGGEFIN